MRNIQYTTEYNIKKQKKKRNLDIKYNPTDAEECGGMLHQARYIATSHSNQVKEIAPPTPTPNQPTTHSS